MKRLTAGLLALMLLATLLPGCGKKEQWNVDNFFLSGDGATYSVSYRHGRRHGGRWWRRWAAIPSP